MSTVNGNYYGGIVKDGLTLLLDAAKRDSYPRVGTTWTDLSRNGNNGTLTNFSNPSPQTIWSDSNGGSIVFDGTNDYVNCGTVGSLGSDPTSSFSVSAWVKTNSNSIQTLFEKYQGITIVGVWGWYVNLNYPSTNGITFVLNRSQVIDSIISTTNVLSSNTWINISVTYNGSTGYLYTNGVLKSSGSTVGGSVNNRNFNLGTLTIHNTQFLSGNISNLLAYNKVLSDSEVLQNYNALKERYNNLWKDSYLWLDTDVWKDQII